MYIYSMSICVEYKVLNLIEATIIILILGKQQ